MRKILAAYALFAYAFCAQAYELVARVSVEDEARWRFDIELANNDTDFTALQMDITLDDGAKLKQKDISCGDLLIRHSLMLRPVNGRYCLAAYNMGNRLLKERNGLLFSFFIDADVKGIAIDKIIFVKTDGTSQKPDISPEASDADGKDSDVPEVQKVVYDMEGEQTYSIDRRGIVIRNGKIAEE